MDKHLSITVPCSSPGASEIILRTSYASSDGAQRLQEGATGLLGESLMRHVEQGYHVRDDTSPPSGKETRNK